MSCDRASQFVVSLDQVALREIDVMVSRDLQR